MSYFSKLTAAISAFLLIASSLQSTEYLPAAYAESRRTSSITPAVAVGTIAVVAIIAVIIQNSSHSHGHGHTHS